ncbi:ADP-ribosylglycohydrolase, partial [Paenibacillus aceris]|nr:ADP-ribosylglycohydrolase [Paenibacillus aceris]
KLNHVGEPYALVGHVRFDKGGAMRVVPLLYYFNGQSLNIKIVEYIF